MTHTHARAAGELTPAATAARPAGAAPAPVTPPSPTPPGEGGPRTRTGLADGAHHAELPGVGDSARPGPAGQRGEALPAGPTVATLDLSIAATGVGIYANGIITTHTIRTDPKHYGKSLAETRRRMDDVRTRIWDHFPEGPFPALITIEGPSYGSKGNALHQLAGLWWLIYDALIDLGHAVAIVPPGVLKKYATGRGDADKPDMRMHLFKRTGVDQKDNNQADAHWLALASLDWLGQALVKMPKQQRDALDGAVWPT